MLDYQAIEKDGRTLIYPNVKEIPTNFEGMVELLTPDYFNEGTSIKTESFGNIRKNRAELKLNKNSNIGPEFELYLIDSSNNLPNGLPTEGVKGLAISGYLSESLDLKFSLPHIFHREARSIYENLLISILQKRDYHEIEKEINYIEKKNESELGVRSPLCLWVGPYNDYSTHFEFYLFNPNKERVDIAIRELPLFSEFIMQNPESVNNLVASIADEKLTKIFGENELGSVNPETLKKLKEKSEKRQELTDKLLKGQNFSELASLMYKNGADYFCLFH